MSYQPIWAKTKMVNKSTPNVFSIMFGPVGLMILTVSFLIWMGLGLWLLPDNVVMGAVVTHTGVVVISAIGSLWVMLAVIGMNNSRCIMWILESLEYRVVPVVFQSTGSDNNRCWRIERLIRSPVGWNRWSVPSTDCIDEGKVTSTWIWTSQRDAQDAVKGMEDERQRQLTTLNGVFGKGRHERY